MSDLNVRSVEVDSPLTYDASGVKVLRGVVGPELTAFCATYLKVLASIDRMGSDHDVPDALSIYGDPAFDTLVAVLTGSMEAALGRDLLPTYSFARLYFRDDQLAVHRDRPSCEHSLTLHLGSAAGAPWPICFNTMDGTTLAVELQPGDAVAYQGIRVPHWRGPCPVEWYSQVFLHWVDAAGEHTDLALDGRDRLGLPEPGLRHGG